MHLSQAVIRTRMQEWRNLQVQNTAQGKRILRLEAENKALRAENAALRAVVASQAIEIQTLKLQMEELRTIVFGKKKKLITEDDDLPPLAEKVRTIRSKESYRRTLPKPTDVTHKEHHALAHQHPLTKRAVRIFYVHDIPAAVVPVITKHTIETGYCTTCKRNVSAMPLPAGAVTFGSHIKRFVAALSTVHRLSHPQIQLLLKLHFNTAVSDGEVAKMLAQEAERLRVEKERLKSSIQVSSIRHIDESSWEVCIDDGQGKFCWIMADGLSPDRVYELGRSRGKGNAENLLGNTNNITVSDDYGAYRTLTNHQLCFAHLARDIRDLAQSPSLEKRITDHCKDLSIRLSGIYREIDARRDIALTEYFSQQLQSLTVLFSHEPQKLSTLKATLLKNIPKYLTCLKDPRIPLTNNRAERDIRHIVLKRNVSFGSRNAKGAEHTGILLSCLMSRLGRGTLQEYLQGV